MTAQTLTQPEQFIQLSGISWETYEILLAQLSLSQVRLTYNRGHLEMSVRSSEHELYKTIIGRFVETLAEELQLNIAAFGSTTFQLPESIGVEPDECFYIQNIAAVLGKKRIDLNRDPAPDLIVEIEVASSSEHRLQIYAGIGVPEVWLYNGERLIINLFENGAYIEGESSLAFPALHILEIVKFLQQAETMDYLELVKSFRDWVKSEIQHPQ